MNLNLKKLKSKRGSYLKGSKSKRIRLLNDRMKIIFLDIDGVVTSVRTGWYNMDIYVINFLRWVCKNANAKIVISSTWRYNHGHDFWKTIFEDYLNEDFKTPDLIKGLQVRGQNCTRGSEIQAWLDKHNEVEKYLILDDDSDMLEHQMENLIQTDSMDGMLSEHMMAVRTFFKIEGYPKEEKKLYQHRNMFAETHEKVKKSKLQFVEMIVK